MKPLVYDYSGVLLPQTGLHSDDLVRLGPWLDLARREMAQDLELWQQFSQGRASIPEEKRPLDTAFISLPHEMLQQAKDRGEPSELERIRRAADSLRQLVDRVVIVGIGGSYMGSRALFEACCAPYHNELSRSDRAGCPRIYFEGNNVDPTTLAALRSVLGQDPQGWGIVVVSKSGSTLETAVAFRLLLNWLIEDLKGDLVRVRQRVIVVTGAKGRLRNLAHAMEFPHVITHPEGVGGRFSVLSAVGLLPAALMGLNLTALLQGAAEMTDRFWKAPVGQNPPLDYAGICHLMETTRGATLRVLATWGQRLEAVGLWYDQLLAESLGKHDRGPTPLSVVNTRDLHSRGQQHQEGTRDKLITHLYVDPTSIVEPLKIERSARDEDDLNALAGKTVSAVLEAARLGTYQAYRDARRPQAEIRLPARDEYSLGQLFQMLMLATVVEGRLIGINPYGQPGVEAYKRHMNAILRGGKVRAESRDPGVGA